MYIMNVNKRFLKEIRQLYIQQSQRDLHTNDYLIYYDETDINKLHAIIRGPSDSVYRHKFIRLDFMIPDNYPHSPPEVIFINYDGVRIHPNIYENGKCCATILNTWGDDKFEKWTSSMGIETILLTFHSFLDNNPYTYEPGGRDDPSYTVYVQHQSWTSCLLRYLQNEQIELFTEFMYNYLLLHIDSIFNDLYELSEMYPDGYYQTRCFEIETFSVNYSRIISLLEYYYNYIEFQESHQIYSFDEFINMDYNCCICYDTTDDIPPITLVCKHRFHKACLQSHIQFNNNICPMCRRELIEDIRQQGTFNIIQQGTFNIIQQGTFTDDFQEENNSTDDFQEENNSTDDFQEENNSTDDVDIQQDTFRQQEDTWMINPLTRRRIKIGGRTYNYLKSNGDI